MPVMTCSQRTAKLSQSQKMAKSVIRGPLKIGLYGLRSKRKEGTRPMTFKKKCKILSPLPKPHGGSGPHGLSRQHRSLRPGGGTRQPVVRGPRHAHLAGGCVEPHQGAGKTPRRQAFQPDDAAIDADRARHCILQRRQAGARSDHRGRGGGERAVGPAARHDPGNCAARSRPPAHRLGHSRLPRQIP